MLFDNPCWSMKEIINEYIFQSVICQNGTWCRMSKDMNDTLNLSRFIIVDMNKVKTSHPVFAIRENTVPHG
ncbi:hypothetical protein EDI29_12195 [Pectobacterium polonicum]|nr:hypothetical protein EDI29_12195 [Pectobacterium polonicum]